MDTEDAERNALIHPSADKIRKAAKDALELLEGLEPILGTPGKVNPVLTNLREALK